MSESMTFRAGDKYAMLNTFPNGCTSFGPYKMPFNSQYKLL